MQFTSLIHTGRFSNVFIGTIAGIIGGILPVLALTWLSWDMKVRTQDAQLDSYATQVFVRTETSLSHVTHALEKLSSRPFHECSPHQIAAMRKAMFGIDAIREIGYFGTGNRLACTTWGEMEQSAPADQPEFTTRDGTQVTPNLHTSVLGKERVVALRYGDYNALLNSRRLIDVIVGNDIYLALVSPDKTLVAQSGQKKGEANYNTPFQEGNLDEMKNDHFTVVKTRGDWTVIAATPKSILRKNLQAEVKWTLPVGALIGLLIAILFVRASRKTPSLESELQAAIKEKRIVVHYQPIINLRTMHCQGAEALVRWNRSDGEMVSPDIFIPMAEASGLITDITEHVIRTAIHDLGPLLEANKCFHVSINASPEDLKTARMLEVLSQALENTSINADQIWLEATERGFINIDEVSKNLNAARRKGYFCAIDDFGTGYSCLQYLQTLPIDILKIDKAFVDMIGKKGPNLIEHIIGIAKSQNLLIVAEGIEHADQEDYLITNGVDFAQGWRYSKALPLKEFNAFHRHTCSSLGHQANSLQHVEETPSTYCAKS